MKVISVNIGFPQEIIRNNHKELTGYFKKAVDSPIYLDKDGVKNDFVGDKIHHGGIDKACYFYGLNNYHYWENFYPNLKYDYGMFGENVTIDFLDESQIKIGDIYKVGNALVQVSQPRQPCYKLGIKFNDPKVVSDFLSAPFPGIYVRILEAGEVKVGDTMHLIESYVTTQTVLEIYQLIYKQKLSKEESNSVLVNPYLAKNVKDYLAKKLNKLNK